MRVHCVAIRSSTRAAVRSPERPADIIATHEHPQGVCRRLRQVRLADFFDLLRLVALYFRYVFRNRAAPRTRTTRLVSGGSVTPHSTASPAPSDTKPSRLAALASVVATTSARSARRTRRARRR